MQWAKNPAARAQVAAEVWVQSLAWRHPHAMGVTKKKKKSAISLNSKVIKQGLEASSRQAWAVEVTSNTH